MAGKAIMVWLVLLVVIVVLGGLREKVLSPRVGERAAHQLGTVAACLAVFVVVSAFMPWLAPASARQSLGLGVLWVALAVAFELGFFHFAMKVPWSELLADYNLSKGRLLLLLWLTVLLAPVVCWSMRR